MKLLRLAAFLISGALAGSAQAPKAAVMAGPPPGRTLIWVVQAGNRLAAYDAGDFHLWQTLALPPEATGHPERILISGQGAVLVTYPAGENLSQRRFWQSDPRLGSSLTGGADDKMPAPGGGFLVTSASPDVFFSSDPERLFWFENRKQTSVRNGLEISVKTVFLAWTSDRRGESVQQIASIALPPCPCATGACEETCPEMLPWAPETGVNDFFFLTRWVPGQTEPEFQQTDVYRLRNGSWVGEKLPAPVEQFADAADRGNLSVEIVPDGGCCGWVNESNDQTFLNRNGQSTVLYDERARFHNDDYDVSFFTRDVHLSPDNARVAYTLATTQQPGQEIRLADSGKENADELQRVKSAMTELPRVEVVALNDPKKIAVSLPGELAGWLDSKRILIFQAGMLSVVDVDNGARTPTPIKASDARRVFVR